MTIKKILLGDVIGNEYYREMQRLTDKGIKDALDHANSEWKKMALGCVIRVAGDTKEFTVDRVRFFVQKSPLKTHDNRAMGGVMKVAQKIGLIEPTGETRPSKVGHKVPMQVWRSCIYNLNL